MVHQPYWFRLGVMNFDYILQKDRTYDPRKKNDIFFSCIRTAAS
jgi:hypothetical protein